MPSTTTNYGWTYPISSDDLNAGATSIGSLATGADTSLKAEADARAAADTTLQNNINTEAAARAQKLQAVTFSTTTSSVATLNFSAFTGFAGIGQIRKFSGGALLALNQAWAEYWIVQPATNTYVSPMYAFLPYTSQTVYVTILLTT